ncbi:hypothetical protein KIPB_011823, partial [Kipferlia bialata]
WDDMHRKTRGLQTDVEIYEERRQLERDMTQVYAEAQEHIAMEKKTLEELEDMEDSFDDSDDFLEEYKERRRAEMRAYAELPKFGDLKWTNAQEYTQEVQEPVPCVVHLSQQHIPACNVLNARLKELSHKFGHVKFLAIKATDAIKNYPDHNCPTLVLYKDGKCLRQLVGTRAVGGRSVSADELEWMLAEQEMIKTDLEKDPRQQTATASSLIRTLIE